MSVRDQKFAQRAYDSVAKFSDPKDKEFARMCRKLPTLILQTGLCQALAFVQAKNPDVCKALVHVTGEPDLFEAARTQGMTKYLRLTDSTLLAASFLKRYAEVFGL